MADCLDDDTLAAIADGLLDPDAMAMVDEHIDDCEACRGLMADLGRSAVDASAEPAPAERIGQYDIQRILGADSIGIVYAARDPDLDRAVALKLIPTRGRDPEKLLAEATTISRLDHENIVTVHAAEIWRDQILIAAELIDGVPMPEWLGSGPGLARILAAFAAAGRGLAAAHAAGVIHGDFRSEHVRVARSGRVAIADFGLARLAGIPTSMAPEQLEGGPADAASDQFAFGVALYEALAGRHPFVVWGKQVNVDALRAGRVERLDGIPRRLRQTVLRALSADPSRRFRTMTELVARLELARRYRAIPLAIAGTLAAIAVASVALGVASERSSACDAAAERDAGRLWNASRRDRVRAVYEATDVAWAIEAQTAAGAAIDRAVKRWQRARVEVCAALERNVGDPAARDRRACLEQRALDISALVAALETADPVALAAAGDAAWVANPGCEPGSARPSPR